MLFSPSLLLSFFALIALYANILCVSVCLCVCACVWGAYARQLVFSAHFHDKSTPISERLMQMFSIAT